MAASHDLANDRAYTALSDRAIGALKWSVIRSWGSRLFSFITLMVLIRLLNPVDFGIVALAGVYLALLAPFIDSGFGDAIVQKHELAREHLDTAFWTSLGIGVFLFSASLIAADGIALLFNEPELARVVRWLSVVFVLSGLTSTQQALLKRRMEFRQLAIRSTGGTIVGGCVGILFAVQGQGVWSLVAQTIGSAAAGTVLLWRVADWRPRLRFSITHFRELFTFGGAVLGVSLLNFVNRRADDMIIGIFLGPTALGYYSVAYKALRVVTDLLTSVVSSVTLSLFSQLQRDQDRLKHAFLAATQWTSLVAFPVFVALTLVAPEFVAEVFGRQWEPSVRVMQILAFIGIIHSVLYFHSSVMLAMGRSGLLFAITGLGAAVNVVAFLLTVRWGIVAVAAAYVIRAYILSPLSLGVVSKLLNMRLRDYILIFSVPVTATAVMAASIAGVRALLAGHVGDLSLLLVAVATGIVMYGAALWAVGREFVEVAVGRLSSWLRGPAAALSPPPG